MPALVTVTSPDQSQLMKLDQNFMLFHTALLDSALYDSIALKIPMWPELGVSLIAFSRALSSVNETSAGGS